MATLLQGPGPIVAKKKTVPTVQVRLSRDVADLAAIVAAYERTQSSDLLSEILRPILKERHTKHVEAEAAKIAAADAELPKPRKGKP